MIINLNSISQGDTSAALNDMLIDAVKTANEVVVDLTGVKNLDFEELKLILSCGIRCREHGKPIKMINVSEAIRGQLIMFGVSGRNEEVVLNG